ncbi:Abca7, partial [Symbiodinium microadriaticum]
PIGRAPAGVALDGASEKVAAPVQRRDEALGPQTERLRLFLDEPSAAVDAGAKRHLWKVIRMRSRDQTVVLTTHSMEAEALCNRIAIQASGASSKVVSGFGSTAGRGKYGSGYQLELFCDPPADEFSSVPLPLPYCADASPILYIMFLFQLPPLTEMRLTLGNIFIEVQKNMAELGLSDYSITQPSLEQVFVRFAREQEEDLEECS